MFRKSSFRLSLTVLLAFVFIFLSLEVHSGIFNLYADGHSHEKVDRLHNNGEEDTDHELIVEEVIIEDNIIPVGHHEHWAKKYIDYGYEHHIIEGYLDNSFQPDALATRAEVVKMVVESKHFDKSHYKGKFSDVKSEDWFSEYVQTGIERNLIRGYSDGEFKPNSNITRAEVIKILTSIFESDDLSEEEVDEVLSEYLDKNEVPLWVKTDVAKAIKHHIIKGYDAKLNLGEDCTRAEILTMIYKMNEE